MAMNRPWLTQAIAVPNKQIYQKFSATVYRDIIYSDNFRSHRWLPPSYTRQLTHLLVSTLHIVEALNCLWVTSNRYSNSIWAALFWCDACAKNSFYRECRCKFGWNLRDAPDPIKKKTYQYLKIFRAQMFVPDSKRTRRKRKLFA
jgi:hypothetical protein